MSDLTGGPVGRFRTNGPFRLVRSADGFSFPYAPPPGTLFQVRIKRNGQTQYKVFSGEGTFHTNVSKHKTTRIDPYIK